MDDGGFNVGYITAGEYLRYTVDVAKKSERHEAKRLQFSTVTARTKHVPSVFHVSVHRTNTT